MAKIKVKTLTDNKGENFYPLTHGTAVVNDQGVNMEDRMTHVEDTVEQKSKEQAEFFEATDARVSETEGQVAQFESNVTQEVAGLKQAQNEFYATTNTRVQSFEDDVEARLAEKAKIGVVDETGDSVEYVMSQAAVTRELTELEENKVDKESIVQKTGDSETEVMSQKAVSNICLSLTDEANSIRGEYDAFRYGWTNGSYYEDISASVARRYRVLKVRQGDKFKLIFSNNNFFLWAYFADEEGVLSYGQYKNNYEGIVSPINGRIPTEIRFTAVPAPDAVITEELWQQFSIQCLRTSIGNIDSVNEELVNQEELISQIDSSVGKVSLGMYNIFEGKWHKGSYYENQVEMDTRKYKVFNVKIGTRFSIKYNSTAWEFWIYFADSNGVIDYIHVTPSNQQNASFVINYRNGRLPSEVRITTVPIPDGIITDELWSTFDVECFVSQSVPREDILKKVTIAEWNFGLFNNGELPLGLPTSELENKLQGIKNLLASLSADVLIATEILEYIDTDETTRTYETLLQQFYPYYKFGSNYMAVFSKYPFSSQTVMAPDNRPYEIGSILIDGSIVGFAAIHPMSAEGYEAEEARIRYHRDVIERLSQYKISVVAGDFNNYVDRELDVYRNAGWSLGNCGYFGNIDTWKPHTRKWFIDNIVSKGASINMFKKIDNRGEVSDHYPVVANISFL